jgi:hypothetical protein
MIGRNHLSLILKSQIMSHRVAASSIRMELTCSNISGWVRKKFSMRLVRFTGSNVGMKCAMARFLMVWIDVCLEEEEVAVAEVEVAVAEVEVEEEVS